MNRGHYTNTRVVPHKWIWQISLPHRAGASQHDTAVFSFKLNCRRSDLEIVGFIPGT
jgi:hypothetical protein